MEHGPIINLITLKFYVFKVIMYAGALIKSPFEDTKQRLEDLKKSNETITVFGFEAEDCEYLIITSDKNIKLPKHFLQYVCDDFSSFTKEIDLSEVPGEVVISILSLHLPRTEITRGKKISFITQ